MAYVLLLEESGGDTIGVRFQTIDEARDWEDRHELTALGCVRIVNRSQALTLVNGE